MADVLGGLLYPQQMGAAPVTGAPAYGLLDMLNPQTAMGMQLAGTFGGLGALGAGLMQAGASRPVGQAGPTMADAFNAFGQGRRQSMMGAYQDAQMQRQQARAADLQAAMSSQPDEQLTPTQRALRTATSTLPAEIRALADPEQLSGLAIQRAQAQSTPMTAAEVQALGLPAGTVVYKNNFTGQPTVLHQSKLLSPEEFRQQVAIAGAGKNPTATWTDVRDAEGNIVGQRSSFGQFHPIQAPGMSEGSAWNIVMRYAPAVAQGKLDVGSPEGRQYLAAQTMLTQPKPQPVTREDGSQVLDYREPNFPFPRLQPPGAGAAPATPAAALPRAAADGAAGPAPGAPVAVTAPGQGVGQGTVLKPAPPLTESQANSTMYLGRMKAAEDRMKAIESTGYTPGNLFDNLAGRAGTPGNYALSPAAQQYKQAAADWITAVLRKESGAVISETEFKRDYEKFFPQPGDSADVIAQKRASRETAMRGLAAGTGRAGMNQPEPPPPPAAPTLRWNPATGRVEPVR